MASESLFVLHQVGWEYNDEYFYSLEDNAGWTRQIFRTRPAAERQRETLEREEWRTILTQPSSQKVADYTHDGCALSDLMDDTRSDPQLVADLAAVGITWDPDADDDDLVIPVRAYKDWEIDQIRGVFAGLTFYEIDAVPFADE